MLASLDARGAASIYRTGARVARTFRVALAPLAKRSRNPVLRAFQPFPAECPDLHHQPLPIGLLVRLQTLEDSGRHLLGRDVKHCPQIGRQRRRIQVDCGSPVIGFIPGEAGQPEEQRPPQQQRQRRWSVCNGRKRVANEARMRPRRANVGRLQRLNESSSCQCSARLICIGASFATSTPSWPMGRVGTANNGFCRSRCIAHH